MHIVNHVGPTNCYTVDNILTFRIEGVFGSSIWFGVEVTSVILTVICLINFIFYSKVPINIILAATIDSPWTTGILVTYKPTEAKSPPFSPIK
jgi:hypothetical protein